MNPQEIEMHLRHLVDCIWNRGELEVAQQLCRKQVVMHFPQWQHLIGVSAYQDYVTHVHNLFPDFKRIIKILHTQ